MSTRFDRIEELMALVWNSLPESARTKDVEIAFRRLYNQIESMDDELEDLIVRQLIANWDTKYLESWDEPE